MTIRNSVVWLLFVAVLACAQTKQLYDIGNPSNDEQRLMELTNRARLDPVGEGKRLVADKSILMIDLAYRKYSVNLDVLAQEFAALRPVPPLAFNAKLNTTAAIHNQGKCSNNCFPGHWPGGGLDFSGQALEQRWLDNGFVPIVGVDGRNVGVQCAGENLWGDVYIHDGWQADWGNFPPGHREALHGVQYRVAGIGVLDCPACRSGGGLIATIDLSTETGFDVPFITGVVYRNLPRTPPFGPGGTPDFYDPGEGIGGTEVDVSGTNWYAVTSSSGGYAVPVPGDGVYAVTFRSAKLNVTTEATITGRRNFKLDVVDDKPVTTRTLGTTHSLSALGGASSGARARPYPVHPQRRAQ